MNHLRYSSTLDFHFVAVSEGNCPCTAKDLSGCSTLPECSYNMNKNDLCEADKRLPDGNSHHAVYNCLSYDVFEYIGGKLYIFHGKIHNKILLNSCAIFA